MTARVIASASVLAVGLSACSTSTDDGYRIGISPVSGSLVPGNTTDITALNITGNIFTGLTSFDGSGDIRLAVAESLESSDQLSWTIRLQPGWRFHDGSPVTASSFVDAWNYVAYSKNGQSQAPVMSNILGYAQVSGPDPTSSIMSGLRVINDREFTVTLSQPDSQFPVKLTNPAFSPLPPQFFRTPQTFFRSPIGNGPYRLVSFHTNSLIQLEAWDNYPLGAPSRDVSYAVYENTASSSADVANGTLDAYYAATSVAQGEVGTPVQIVQNLVFPLYSERWQNIYLRNAVAMSIDRAAVLANTPTPGRQPVTSWVTSNTVGYQQDACGDYCTFNPDLARENLLQAGEQIDPIRIAYPRTLDTRNWAQAVCASVTQTLGLACELEEFDSLAEFNTTVSEKQTSSLIVRQVAARAPDIPSFLAPSFVTGQPGNVSGYSNPEFDQVLATASTTPSEAALPIFQSAVDILAANPPSIPLWSGALTVHGQTIEVPLTPYGYMQLENIR